MQRLGKAVQPLTEEVLDVVPSQQRRWLGIQPPELVKCIARPFEPPPQRPCALQANRVIRARCRKGGRIKRWSVGARTWHVEQLGGRRLRIRHLPIVSTRAIIVNPAETTRVGVGHGTLCTDCPHTAPDHAVGTCLRTRKRHGWWEPHAAGWADSTCTQTPVPDASGGCGRDSVGYLAHAKREKS